MNVLCFADTRFPIERANGVQTMATCHALAGRGHVVTLVSRPDRSTPPRDPFAFYGLPPVDTLHFEQVGAARGGTVSRVRYLLAAPGRCSREPDAVVLTRDLGLAAFLLRRAGPTPRVVYEAHGVAAVVAEEMPRLLGRPDLAPTRRKLDRLTRRERLVWQRAPAWVSITRALHEELTSRYGPRSRAFVVPDGAWAPGTRTGSEPDAPAGERRRPLVAYAGHLYPWKGADVLVEALARVPEVEGLIVGGHPGEADLGRVRGLVESLGLRDRVTITGLVPPADVARHLAGASMLVLPNTASAISERYTSPLKLFEYLALGRPIIASDLPALREVLTDEVSALLVPAGQPDELAAAIRRVASDPALAARLGSAAAALLPGYTWSARAERLEAAMEAALR